MAALVMLLIVFILFMGTVIVGMIRYDIQLIQHEKTKRLHPRSRRWRQQLPVQKFDTPRTTSQLFSHYRSIVAAPFMAVRAGLGVTATPRRTDIYLVSRLLVQLCNLVTLLYTSYLAVVLHQTELLLIYLIAFLLWFVWAIGRAPLNRRQKISYLLLAPSSLLYFALLALVAPFRRVL
jgi:hypothetical protein